MRIIPLELGKPENESDFEKMCFDVYSVHFEDKLAKMNGRRGQAQRGVDIYVRFKDIGRIGVQCKKYQKTKLTWQHVEEEVKKADEGNQPIAMLLIATTTDSDAALQQKVLELSDQREIEGKFLVGIDFWEDIALKIEHHPILVERHAPNSAGGAFRRIDREAAELKRLVIETNSVSVKTLEAMVGFERLPMARSDSLNKFVNDQLDRTNVMIKAGRYKDALENIEATGKDHSDFDAHQKARWHLQRGICLWLSKEDSVEAARLFAKAYECCPNDERMAAARIRGLMLSGDNEAAIKAGLEEVERFPLSSQMWVATANARILAGDTVGLDDAPLSMRGEADVLLFCAIAAHQRGDKTEALLLGEKAVEHPEAGFFSRDTFLGFAVEDCGGDPVLALYGLLPEARSNRLAKAVAMFEPRHERLWGVQTETVARSATNLGFAFLLLRENEKALELLGEARGNAVEADEFLRIELQALDESGRKTEALKVARERLNELPAEALAAACEMAATTGDAEFVKTLIEKAAEAYPENTELSRYMTGLHWGVIAKTSGKVKAAETVLAADPIKDGGIDLLCPASRILRWAERPMEAEELVSAAMAKLGPESSQGDRLLVAETLFNATRWTEAAKLYEELIGRAGRGASELHARLLVCYVETDRRSKAKALLDSLPEGWADIEDLRRCAMDLGQKVGDWRFLEPLAERQVAKAPGEATSWLFKLLVLARVAQPARFQDELRGVPEYLSGLARNVASLAGLEIKYGESEKGLRRLYRLARRKIQDPDTLSFYLLNFLVGDLPPIEQNPASVGPGCSVVFEGDEGKIETLVVDPSNVGELPERDGFFPPGSESVAPFLGKAVGDEVGVPMLVGGLRRVRIVGIGSAYHRMFEVAHERAGMLGGLPYVKTVGVGNSGDPEHDLAKIHEELIRSRATSSRVMEVYSTGLLTLSRLSEALGRSPVDVCLGWPREAPSLFVCTGLTEDRLAALKKIQGKRRPFVADSLALTELVRLGVGHALSVLGDVLVSPKTKEIVEAFAEEARSDRSFGTAFDADGRLGFHEHGEGYRQERIAFAERLSDLVSNSCRVQPAYGDFGDGEPSRLTEVLGAEEREALLLARECGADVFTLDGKLRMLAKHFLGLDGVWPQVVVMAAADAGVVSVREGESFSAQEFLSNRSFVSLRSADLLWMCSQGDWWLQTGMRELKHYLASGSTERDSALRVVMEFLDGVARQYTQLGAFGEILCHVAEAIFRRPDCPENWRAELLEFVARIMVDAAGTGYALDILNARPMQDLHRKFSLIEKRVGEAAERSKNPESSDTVRVRVLFCSSKPSFTIDWVRQTMGENLGSTEIASNGKETRSEVAETTSANKSGLKRNK